MTSTTWKPLFADGLAGEVRTAVEAIAADLAALESLVLPFGPDPEFSLGRGTTGVALFFLYLDEALPGKGYGDFGLDLLGQAVEVAARSPTSGGLWEGVPGVAWTLEHLLARPRLGDVWDRDALALAERSSKIPEVEDGGLRDGVAGIAHLSNRLAQATGDERFAEEARAAFGRLLAMRRPGEGIGGFLTRIPDGRGRAVWTDDPGFLRGASGVGLALLAGISTVAPAWDRLLLAAIPAAGQDGEERATSFGPV
ncbi:MAG: lanthionine synthetase LanC family protein [Thermoanaerobaculia bacterium]